MKNIDEIFERLDGNENIESIRLDIANLIAESLVQKRDSLGYWGKAHFADAINALGYNIHAGNRDSSAWLKLSLNNIINAHIPHNERSEEGSPKSQQIEELTFDHLVFEIRKLGGYV
jgi:hypothetical protein